MSGFEFDEQILGQPAALAALLDGDPVDGLDHERPLVFTGIGSSLHACRVAAVWVRRLTGGRVRPPAIDAHDLALSESVRPEDQVVVVSHRGTKRYPNAVLGAGRSVGATTVAVTGQGEHRPDADIVLRTCPQERASTHTVSYTSSLLMLGRLICSTFPDEADELSGALREVPLAIERTLDLAIGEPAVDATVRDGAVVAVMGAGLDEVTADEAALKIKEGTYRWAEGLHTEFALHGTPAVFSPSTSAYVILPAGDDGGRSRDLAGFLGRVGAQVVSCGTESYCDLRFAPVPRLARPLVCVVPFQRLVSAAAQRLGSNPDLTHLEEEPWAGAMRAVSL